VIVGIVMAYMKDCIKSSGLMVLVVQPRISSEESMDDEGVVPAWVAGPARSLNAPHR